MKKIFTAILLLTTLIGFSQNPKIIKTVTAADVKPSTLNQDDWRYNEWNGNFFYLNGNILCVTNCTNTGTKQLLDLGTGVSEIRGFVPVQDFIYLFVYKVVSSVSQYEIWRSDGTTAGTSLVKAVAFDLSQFYLKGNLGVIGNTVLFGANDGVNGNELWKSDGTTVGTIMLKDINPGAPSSSPAAFCKLGNKILFAAYTPGAFYKKLFETDGTVAGTQQIMVPEPFHFDNVASPTGMVSANGKAFFYANNEVNGWELWTTDGTASGTFMLKDFNPGSGDGKTSSNVVYLRSNSKFVFFIIRDASLLTHLWRSDGTVAGTIQLDVNINQSGYSATGTGNAAEINESYLYFFNSYGADQKILRTDGTVAGTTITNSMISYSPAMKLYKNAVWFTASNFGSVQNLEPWRSDGTNNNTGKAFEVDNGYIALTGSFLNSNPKCYFVSNNKLYFWANNATTGFSLYEYNGDFTFNGTVTGGRWKDSANWNSMMPPGITDTVFINAGTPNSLNINGSNAYAGVLQLGNNAALTLTNTTDSLFINNKLMSNNTNSFTGNGFVVTKNNGTDSVQLTNSFTANNLLVQSKTNLQAGTLTINNTLTLNNSGKLILNNNNAVLTGNTSTATGNTTSYIITNGTGKLTVQNMGAGARTSAINFPIGTTDNYNPLQITNTGTADAFSARVQPQAYGSYSGETSSGSPYQLGAVNATWFITEENTGGSNATINLQWNASQELVGFDRNATTLAHYTAGAWSLGGISAANGTNPYNYSRAGITSFSPFAIMNNNAALPFYLVRLSVVKSNNANKLSWNIVATNADNIVIEKSANGINFSKLYSSVFFATGSYNDVSSIGKTYYRLKVSDKNGNTSHSNIVVIDDKASNDIKVYPTVFNQSFTIQNNSNNHLQLQLFDVAGKLVFQKTLLQGTNLINTETLSKQTYYYQIINNSSMVNTGKIIKQ